MARDFAQIERAAALSAQTVTSDNVLSLPPGYIQGFNVTLRKDYTVTVSGGAANVSGRQVKMESDHQLTLQDWVVPRMDTPQHYYIYLSKEGDIRVDIVKPKFNSFYSYYEQPDTGWRVIGKLFVKNTDIVYAIQDVSRSGRSVTVAPADYVGYADYYCDGTNDHILINAAILYVFTAYGGGTVTLLEGTFNTTTDPTSGVAIKLYSYISLVGSGAGTQFSVTFSVGPASSYFLYIDTTFGVKVSNLKIASTSLSASTSLYGISLTNSNYATIDNIVLAASLPVFIFTSSGGYSTIQNCTVDTSGSVTTGISCNVARTKILNNTFRSVRATNFRAIYVLSTNCVITNNTVYNVSATGSVCAGISLDGANYSTVSNNSIDTVKNSSTATNAWGIVLENTFGNTSVAIKENYCYNNGSDTGIANANSNNFSDSGGTDTQVYSNSWQNPNSGEPNVGELHWRPQATATSSGYVASLVTTTAAWSSVSFGAVVPVGAKVAFCNLGVYANSSAAGAYNHYVSFSNDTSATPTGSTNQPQFGFTALAAAAAEQHAIKYQAALPIDANRKTYHYAVLRTNATAARVDIVCTGYMS